MLVDGNDYENEEFGGRAFDGGFMPKNHALNLEPNLLASLHS